MTDKELVKRLEKMAVCVYIAVEETVADDLSEGLKRAAQRIKELSDEFY